jgi:hypothetical protein
MLHLWVKVVTMGKKLHLAGPGRRSQLDPVRPWNLIAHTNSVCQFWDSIAGTIVVERGLTADVPRGSPSISALEPLAGFSGRGPLLMNA